MGEVKDESWLKHGICRALGWDAVVAEGIVKAISDAGLLNIVLRLNALQQDDMCSAASVSRPAASVEQMRISLRHAQREENCGVHRTCV